MKNFKQIITICFFAIALANCGGGGKGSSTQPSSPNNDVPPRTHNQIQVKHNHLKTRTVQTLQLLIRTDD